MQGTGRDEPLRASLHATKPAPSPPRFNEVGRPAPVGRSAGRVLPKGEATLRSLFQYSDDDHGADGRGKGNDPDYWGTREPILQLRDSVKARWLHTPSVDDSIVNTAAVAPHDDITDKVLKC
jgi:hypothetical protein